MRRSKLLCVVAGGLLVLILVLGACRTEVSSGPGSGNQVSEESPSGGTPSPDSGNTSNALPVEEIIPSTPAARFFWGTWIRMDNGSHYQVYEDTVTQLDGGTIYHVSATSTSETMEVGGLGSFTKASDTVIMNGNIPYFRKGGANPSYRMRLVGFVDGANRAAATTIHGWKVTGTSDSYPTYSNTTESNEEGEVTLTAPMIGDTQTVTVSTGSGVIVVPGLTIENNGDFMGTIPLVNSGDYILKITGSIAQEEKLDGYLYGNSYKRYPMTLTITNVSQVKSAMSVCVVENDDPNLTITSSYDLAGVAISTLAPGATKTIDLEVSYGHLTEPFVDTEIKVRITNAQTGNEWVDYVPLRFFRGQVPLTVVAASTEGNQSAALNGFLVHPDGQSQFFSVPHGGSTTIYSPTFPKNQPYLMAFSGATVTGDLSDSTEMFYTVAVGSTEPVAVENSGGGILRHMTFGEPNDSEKTAYPVNENFQAYLSEGEIDYFSVTSNTWKEASTVSQYTISYTTAYGSTPATKSYNYNTALTTRDLPQLSQDDLTFEGWYNGDTRIEVGHKLTNNLYLTAKWTRLITVNSGTINTLSLEAVTGDCHIVVDGEINDTGILYTLGDIIQAAGESAKIHLDLSKTTGLTTIAGFDGCRRLVSVVIPKGVSYISIRAFAYSGLTSVVIPSSVLNIGYCAFEFCSSLTKAIFLDPDGWYRGTANIGNQDYMMKLDNSYYNASTLRSDSWGLIKTSIGERAFSGCSWRTSVEISGKVYSIGDYAFSDCSGLTSVFISKYVGSIGVSAFEGCSKLTSVTFEDTSGWYVTTSATDAANKTGGTAVFPSPTNLDYNARLVNDYATYYWYKAVVAIPL